MRLIKHLQRMGIVAIHNTLSDKTLHCGLLVLCNQGYIGSEVDLVVMEQTNKERIKVVIPDDVEMGTNVGVVCQRI